MDTHYHINQHILTLKLLRNRTHDGAFRGIERRVMMIILALKLLFPSFWIRHYADIQGHALRNRMMEYYVVGVTILMLTILMSGLWSHPIWVIITIYTLMDLIIYLVGLIVLSNLNHAVPNLRRNLILLAVNLFQIVSAFAILYLASGALYYAGSSTHVTTGLEGLYFSFATFATVGYGDMVVLGSVGHIISICQIVTSLLFVSLVLSSVVSKIEITSEG